MSKGPSDIVKCIRDLGYKDFTELQKRAFNYIARKRGSALIIAPTGSGKTEAAVFPVIYHILARKLSPISCIYVTPLRALNRDIERRIRRIGECLGLKVSVRHGDTPESARRRLVEDPPHILVTTPETFTYLIINESLRPYLSNAEFVIIDEFHELLTSKRGLLLLTNLGLFEHAIGKKLRRIALSATIASPRMAAEYLDPGGEVAVIEAEDKREIEISVEVPPCDELCEKLSGLIDDEALASRLSYILNAARSYRSVIVFTNTRSLAEHLGSLLKEIPGALGLGLTAEVHHGSLSREVREDVEERIKKGEVNILVATSSVELGIDIGHIDYVIQYFSPRQASRLVQRVGRSGHKLYGVSRGSVLVTPNALHMAEARVIARRARKGELEREVVHEGPLDVLSYAVAAYALLNPGGAGKRELYEVIKRNRVYSGLSEADYNDVLDYLSYSRIISIKEDMIFPTRRTRLHVYRTSMIPSTRDIDVIDMASGKKIGTLNEEYVVINVERGDVIVLGGRSWRVVGYDEEGGKLYVELGLPDSEPPLIPHWEGENIPVEYEVAREVGDLVKDFKEGGPGGAALGADPEAVVELGDSSTITVDYIDSLKLFIINVYGGTKANSYIKDLLVYRIKQVYPFLDVRAYSTPYAILVQLKGFYSQRDISSLVVGTMRELWKYAGDEYAMWIARESRAVEWRIYQVGQRFGAISPGETKVSRAMLRAFADTVIGREAVKEVLMRDYDIESVRDLALRISRGEVSIAPRSYDKLQRHHVELLTYIENPISSGLGVLGLDEYLQRLLNREVILICLACGYRNRDKVSNLMGRKSYSCPKCGRATLSLIKGEAFVKVEDIERLIKKGKARGSERKLLDDLAERAVLLYRHGEAALLALSARGVGTAEAKRIIREYLNGKDLISAIYESERRFLSVKRYIDRKKR